MSEPTEERTETSITEVSVNDHLVSLGVEAEMITKITDELGAKTVADLANLTEKDLTGIGMKTIPARKLLQALTPKPDSSAAVNAVSFDAILPLPPTEASWLETLRTGGVLKIDQSTVVASIRAALAHRAGLYDVPDKLVKAMEKHADDIEEQVSPEFFQLRDQLTRTSYADIFSAIPGFKGSFVTETRKKQLLQRIDSYLWPAFNDFNAQLRAWQESWMQGAANPMTMMSAFIASASGAGAMPPGLMQPPETGTLRDYGDAVADAINKVFAGTGVQISAALAYEASQIAKTLENPRLPAMIGASNRDQMLRQLNVAVSATYTRLETNLVRYVLSIMQLKDQATGDEEIRYLGALFMLGSQIQNSLNQLSAGGISGIGSTGRKNDKQL